MTALKSSYHYHKVNDLKLVSEYFGHLVSFGLGLWMLYLALETEIQHMLNTQAM